MYWRKPIQRCTSRQTTNTASGNAAPGRYRCPRPSHHRTGWRTCSSQGVASVVAGETDWVLTPAPAAMSLVAGERLRLLGHSMPVTARPLGDTPSIAASVPGFEFSGWIGLLGPKGLPATVTAVLVEAVARALHVRELASVFEFNGAVPTGSTAQEFRSFLERDIAQNRRAIAIAGVQPE